MDALNFHRRQLHRTVRVMLVAWLFALTAGVVNACVLTPPAFDGHGVSVFRLIDASAPDGHSGDPADAGPGSHDGSVALAGHAETSGTSSCLKFCADESSALPKYTVSAPDLGAMPLLAMVSNGHAEAPITAVGTRFALERPLSQGPPLVIRFLRLTL